MPKVTRLGVWIVLLIVVVITGIEGGYIYTISVLQPRMDSLNTQLSGLRAQITIDENTLHRLNNSSKSNNVTNILNHHNIPYSYFIFNSAGKVFAKNGATGTIDYESPVFDTVINDVSSALAKTGGTVYIFGNFTIVATPMVVNSNIAYIGCPAKITLATGANCNYLLTNADLRNGNTGITLKDLTLNGNKNGQSMPYLNIIYFSYVCNSWIEDCNIVNGTQFGIILNDGCNYDVVTGCNVTRCDGDAIRLNHASYNKISNNNLIGSGQHGNGVLGYNSSNCNNVANNYATNYLDYGYVFSTNCQYNTIIGNTAINIGGGVSAFANSDDNTFSGNTISNIISYQGVEITVGSNNNTIIGNILRTGVYHGILIGQSNYNIVSDNYISGFTQCGIMLWANCVQNLVDSNTVMNNNQGHTYYAGIYIGTDNATTNPMVENVISNNLIGNNYNYGIYEYGLTTLGYSLIRGNTVYGSKVSEISPGVESCVVNNYGYYSTTIISNPLSSAGNYLVDSGRSNSWVSDGTVTYTNYNSGKTLYISGDIIFVKVDGCQVFSDRGTNWDRVTVHLNYGDTICLNVNSLEIFTVGDWAVPR